MIAPIRTEVLLYIFLDEVKGALNNCKVNEQLNLINNYTTRCDTQANCHKQ